MTMTRTRRKQKQELVKRAVREADDRQSQQRELFNLRATPAVLQAAYEPALFHHPTTTQTSTSGGIGLVDQSDGKSVFIFRKRKLLNFRNNVLLSDGADTLHAGSRQQIPVAQPLFPSCLLSVVPTFVEMLDDCLVDSDGLAGIY